MCERVEEGGFPGVGVADECDHAQWDGLAGTPASGALAPNCFDGLLNFANAISNAPAVGLQFLFTRSARADSATEARKLFASACQPREQIIQLRKLHLKLAFAGARVAGKNIEDELGAVNHAATHSFFKIAQLAGGQIMIHNP